MISVCVCVCVPNEIHILLRDSDNYGSDCYSRSMQIHTKFMWVRDKREGDGYVPFSYHNVYSFLVE